MIKVWGRLNSINVQKVMWALEELGLAYERVDAGGAFGLNDTPEYRRLNPNGLVPSIEHDGFVLWESNAIVRYLCEGSGSGRLWPADRQVRASADRWMDWHATALMPAMRDAFVQLVRMPAERRDAELVARSAVETERNVGILDAHLASHAYVAGEDFTMGDIAVGASVHRWLNMPLRREERPHLARYHAALMETPSARASLLLPLA